MKPGTPIVCVDELGERFAAAVSTVELHLRRCVEDVVIDTNVFVAAGFNSKSAAARVFEGVREGRFRLIWNEPTRRETESIVRRIGQASPIFSSRKRNLPDRSILRRSPQSQTLTIENS